MTTEEKVDEQTRLLKLVDTLRGYIAALELKINMLHDTYIFEDCTKCGGVISQSCVCINCGFDPTTMEA